MLSGVGSIAKFYSVEIYIWALSWALIESRNLYNFYVIFRSPDDGSCKTETYRGVSMDDIC
jgi:hypothetical protein